MDLFKRLFASVTIVAMALITVAPAGFANAASLSAGDLIKASGAAVYYYGTDGKRYVFPNEATYKTWYADFSKVKTISDSELAAISIGGNVVFRPGTYLVKITTDPKVYAVSNGGSLHWVKSESAAKTLWGNDWAKWVKDVPDAFFTNYSVSSMDIDGTKHPAGSLIKYNGSDKMYLVDMDGKKREFTGSAFADNGFMSKFVLTSPDSITYPNGSGVTGTETMLWDAAQKSSSSNNNTQPGNGALSVQLAADTPAAADVPSGTTSNMRGARNIPFTKLLLTAGGDAVKLTKLAVKREGLSQDTDLANVKLFDDKGVQLGTNQSFNADHKAVFSGFTYEIAAGTTKALWVKADSETTTGGKTGRIKLGVEMATDVTSNAQSVSGSFPIFGNTMTQVAVDVGQLTVSKGPSDPTTTTLDIDDKDFRFMQVRLTAGSTEAVKLHGIAFRDGDASSVSDGDIDNVYLMDNTNNKKYEGTRSGDRFTFNFATPISMDKGKQIDLSLHGDVMGGSGKTVSYSLIDDSDWLLWAEGSQYGYDVAISPVGSTGIDFGQGTPSKAETEGFSINQGSLVVSKGPNSPAAGNVAIGGDDVKIASFLFDVRGEEVRVGSVKVTLTGANGWDVNTESTLYKLVDKDGKIWAGPFDASSGAVTFSTQINFPIGKTELFLTTNIASSGLTTNSSTIVASIANPALTANLANVKGMTSNKTITPTPAAAVTGNTMTAQSAALTLTMASDPIAGTYVIGGTDVDVAKLRLNATTGGEDVKVTSITIGEGTMTQSSGNITEATDCTSGVTATAAPDIASDFVNWKLWSGSTQIGETEQGSSNTVVFNIDDGFVAPKNEVVELRVTADPLKSALECDNATAFSASAGSGVGQDSGVSVAATASGNSPTFDWRDTGALKVNLDGSNPTSQIVASSTTDLEVVRYKLRALYEDIDITTVNVYAGDTNANPTSPADDAANIAANVTKVKLYEGTKLLGQTVFDSAGDAAFKITAGDLRIKKDTDHLIKVVVDLADKTRLTSGNHFYIGFGDVNGDGSTWASAGSYNLVANGYQSGTTITATSITSTGAAGGNVAGGNKFYTYDGILTVGLNANSPSGNFSQGVGTEVLRLDFTATGDEITVSDIQITKSGSCTPDGTDDAYIESTDGNTDYWTFNDAGATTAWGGATRETDDTNITATTTLTVGAGSTKTVKYTVDTSKAVACTDGQTLQYSVTTDAAGTVTNGVEWKDQELGAAVTASDVLIKNIPVYGNVLEI